jgi:hypothetical protein
MIKNILDLLAAGEHLGQSETIEIAKGLYKAPTTSKEVLNKIKRYKSWLSRKQ